VRPVDSSSTSACRGTKVIDQGTVGVARQQQPANEPPHGASLGSTNPGRAGTPSYSIRPSKASICVARERPAKNIGIASVASLGNGHLGARFVAK